MSPVISLRPVNEADSEMLLDWRNSNQVRLFMSDQRKISPEDHHHWLTERIHNKKKLAVVAEKSTRPVGFIQYTVLTTAVAEWGFYKAPGAEAGIGKAICAEGVKWAKDNLLLSWLVAKVIHSNTVSLSVHAEIGFELISDQEWLSLTGYKSVSPGHYFFKRVLHGPG